MNYIVQSSRKADADVAVIFDWIARRSPEGAARWLDAFEAAIRKLKTQADKCVLAPESDEFGIELRQLMFPYAPGTALSRALHNSQRHRVFGGDSGGGAGECFVTGHRPARLKELKSKQ